MRESRALLVTDVVGSTELAARLGDDAMAALWRDHDRCARDLLRQCGGREIDKSDGFLLLFERAADAAAYALAYHRALAALPVPLKARAGLHVGAVELRSNPPEDVALGAKPVEAEGLAKSLAARVMSVAHGGQTLATLAAHASLGASHARSHGHWRMKGLDEPVELFEVGDAQTPWTPPAESNKAYRVVRSGDEWLALRDLRHSLPAERDSFVDRRTELQALGRLFDDGVRLASVLGAGGSGKTRLALRYARAWLGDFDGGAWFCDLSQATTAADVMQAVARGLELDLQGADPMALIGAAIAGRADCLLILDNFEQVSQHAEATLGRWLERAPRARFLVTSRERLRIGGEHVLLLESQPPLDAGILFKQRAVAAYGAATQSPADDRAIGPLVELLDGMPLAIELAAARTRVMPPQMLLARMGERFQLLASRHGRHDRQATLRATFDWSWELLSLHERAALAQLSVFEGGASLAAVEAVVVVGSDHSGAPRPVDVLQSLVEKSLVRPVGRARFALLRTVHDYAQARLTQPDAGPAFGVQAQRAAQARHAAFFAGLGARDAVAERCIELDNLVAAVRRAVALGLHGVAADALKGAWEALRLRGPFALALELAQQVRAMDGLDRTTGAAVDLVSGWVLKAGGQNAQARQRLEPALLFARAGSERVLQGELLRLLGELDTSDGRMDDARSRLDEALAIARECVDAPLECQVLCGIGAMMIYLGHYEAAAQNYLHALEISRPIGDRHLEGTILSNMGLVRDEQGRAAEALGHYEQALAIARETGDRRREGNNLCNLGLLHHTQGRNAEALGALEAALAVAREIGHARLESIALCNLGLVAEAMRLPERALPYYEAALAVARDIADRRAEGQVLSSLGVLQARQGRVEAARHALAAGRQLLVAVSDRISLGLLLCNLAETEHLAGAAAPAREALLSATQIAQETACGPASELGVRVAEVATLVAPSTAAGEQPLSSNR
jgi:predicted ATPase/class 3 adenylate cyclase/Tfp pilus assembly protein PilF